VPSSAPWLSPGSRPGWMAGGACLAGPPAAGLPTARPALAAPAWAVALSPVSRSPVSLPPRSYSAAPVSAGRQAAAGPRISLTKYSAPIVIVTTQSTMTKIAGECANTVVRSLPTAIPTARRTSRRARWPRAANQAASPPARARRLPSRTLPFARASAGGPPAPPAPPGLPVPPWFPGDVPMAGALNLAEGAVRLPPAAGTLGPSPLASMPRRSLRT